MTVAKKKPESNMDYAKPKPRAQRLPGMDEPKVAKLESLAHDYADVRDQRIALSVNEGALKSDIMAEMKRLKKEHYKRDGVEITLVHEKENVKVKIKPSSEEDEAIDDEPSKVDVNVSDVDDAEFEVAEG